MVCHQKLPTSNIIKIQQKTILRISQKTIWTTAISLAGGKPFLMNKGVFGTDCISVNKEIKFINNEIELVEMFNSYYIKIVENMTGIPPDISPLYDLQENDVYCVKQIIKKFETHSRIVEILKNINILEKFKTKEATVSDIHTLLK